MTTYEIPMSEHDWCFACNYFTKVAEVYYHDQIDEEVPLCKECNEEIMGA
jgi:hypothetical protein